MTSQVTLTDEEKKLPYADYFYREMTAPSPELAPIVEKGPINPDSALKFEDLDKILDEGYLDTEIGYTILADGTGYVSSITQMPGVTAEMLDWWFAWHPHNPLRYKIWNPLSHYDTKLSQEDLERLADESLPLNERLWGTTHLVTEDIGCGVGDIEINFVSPEAFGFDMDKYAESNTGTAICAAGVANMLHIARPTSEGIELRTRFWFNPKAQVPMPVLKGLNLHAIEEYANLAGFLPKLYSEYGPDI